MIHPRRTTIFPTLLVTICITSGCSGTRTETDLGASLYTEPAVIEPAVRRDPLSITLKEFEPAAGGIYLPDVFGEEVTVRSTNRPGGPGKQNEPRQEVQSPGSSEVGGAEQPSIPPTVVALPTATIVPTIPAPTAIQDHRLARTTNILVLGSDRRRDTSNWRTDIIMIIALDLETSAAGVISFPRDIYIDEIPGSSPNKINVVDYLGERARLGSEPGDGPKLLGGILSRKLGIPIDHYVRFEFESFQDVVDALGGLTITVDCPIFDEIVEEDLYINLASGTHLLNGKQALAYVRTRRAGGDLERIRRQQRVVWALRQQFLDQNWLPQIPALYASLSNAIQTDLGLIDIAQLVRFGLNVREENVHGIVISPPDMIEQNFRSGMFVFDADWPLISQVTETVFNRPPFVETNTVGPIGDQPYCP